MRPTDVDKIAQAVVGTLGGSNPGLLGCGSLSNPVEFDVDLLQCGTFECGGLALFACRTRFGCGSASALGGTQGAVTGAFVCDLNFLCDAYSLPVCPEAAAVFGCNGLAAETFALP